MRHADELHERVARRDLVGERGAVERIAGHRNRAGRQLRDRAVAHERPHHVPAREELGDQTLPDVAGAAGDEDVGHAPITGGSRVWISA